MANWFYYDTDGQKQGPFNDGQLKWLAKNGKIMPETTVETENGKQSMARKVVGLTFSTELAGTDIESVEQFPKLQDNIIGNVQIVNKISYTGNSIGKSVFSWLFDFAFQDLRLPIVNLWACRVVYVLCLIGVVLWGFYMTFIALEIYHLAHGVGPLPLLLIPLVWFSVIILFCILRLLCEWYLIMFDWIIETTRAARLYVENDKRICDERNLNPFTERK